VNVGQLMTGGEKVLLHAMLMSADGGEACGDIEVLRFQLELFGPWRPDSTLYRTREVDPATLGRLDTAMAVAKSQGLGSDQRSDGDTPLVLTSTHRLLRSTWRNKTGTGPTYKVGSVPTDVLLRRCRR
jgi:hypothetical protein